MFCKKCGKEIADNSEFCQFCGANQGNEPQQEKPQEPVKVIIQQEKKKGLGGCSGCLVWAFGILGGLMLLGAIINAIDPNYSETHKSTTSQVQEQQVKEPKYTPAQIKEAHELVSRLRKNNYITSFDENKNIYYVDGKLWADTTYENKKLLYIALKIINTDANNNVNVFEARDTYTDKKIISTFGVR